jgi:hypothetical protein
MTLRQPHGQYEAFRKSRERQTRSVVGCPLHAPLSPPRMPSLPMVAVSTEAKFFMT